MIKIDKEKAMQKYYTIKPFLIRVGISFWLFSIFIVSSFIFILICIFEKTEVFIIIMAINIGLMIFSLFMRYFFNNKLKAKSFELDQDISSMVYGTAIPVFHKLINITAIKMREPKDLVEMLKNSIDQHNLYMDGLEKNIPLG